jgi:palmitoyl-protein thioesterase
MHGECEWRITNYFEQTLNTYTACMEVSNTESKILDRVYDIESHGATLCQKVQDDENFTNGNFSIVSLSTGGMMARYLIEYCKFDMPIRNVVSFGGPMNGVSSNLDTDRNSFVGGVMDWVVDKTIQFDFMDRIITPADYWRNPKDMTTYLTYSRFLAEANNEVNFSEDRKEAWKHLNNALFIQWSDDATIVPKESAHWGQYDENFEIVHRHDTNLYQQDLIGIKFLEENKKATYIEWPGKHMAFNFTQINSDVLPMLRT